MIRLTRWLSLVVMVISFIFAAQYENHSVLILDGQRLELPGGLLIHEATRFVSLEDMAKQMGLAYLDQGNQLIIRDGYKKIVFHKRHDQVNVNDDSYYMPKKTINIGKKWFVPLSYFCWYQGYTMQRQGNVYYISKRIRRAELRDQGFYLDFACDLNEKNFSLKKLARNKYILELPNSVLSFPRKVFSNKYFNKITIGQISTRPDRASVQIETTQPLNLTKSLNKLVVVAGPAEAAVIQTTKYPAVNRLEPKEKPLVRPKDKTSKQAVWIPDFSQVKDIRLKVKDQVTVLSGKAKYRSGQYVVPLEPVLFPFGYDYRVDEKNRLFIKYGDQEELDTQIIVYADGKDWLVPLQQCAQKLGLGLRWDYRVHSLFVNPIIYAVEKRMDKVSGETAVIKSYAEIDPQDVFALSDPERMVMDIPHSVLDMAEPVRYFSDGNIKSIKVAQFDEETVRVVLVLRHGKGYGLSLSEDGREARLHSAGTIEKIWYQIRNGYPEMTIFAQNLGDFRAQRKGTQLVIDIDNATYKAKPTYYLRYARASKVEGVQQSWTPLMSRMTVTLRREEPVKVFKRQGNLVIRWLRKDTTRTSRQPVQQTTKPFSAKPLTGKTIVIEPGHGGVDVGAVGYGKRYEKWFTLDTSRRIRDKLQAKGARVLMPFNQDRYLSLGARTRFANRVGAHVYISVHFNSFDRSSVHGTETFYYKYNDKALAQAIQKQLITKLRSRNNGVKQRRLFVLFHTRMPSILIEPGFLSNPREYNLLLTPEYRDKIAQAVTEGVIHYFRK